MRGIKQNESFEGGLARFISSDGGRALSSFLMVIIIGCIFNADGAFFKLATQRDALRSLSVYGILAVGQTLVIISGGIDLVQGSMIGFSAVLFSILTIHMQFNSLLSIVIVILAGAVIGAFTGFLIAKCKMQPFIVTLALENAVRGLARAITNNQKVSTNIISSDGTVKSVELPAIFKLIDRKILGGNMTVVTVIFVAIIIITWLILSKHKWGREIYAMGGNLEAARLSGVPIIRSKALVYIFSAALSAIAGICTAAQTTQGDPAAGNMYETMAICMSVIGGTSMVGGRGGMGLTFLGVLTIGYLQKVLSMNAVPEAYRLIITGLIIVVAVLAQGFKFKKKRANTSIK